MLNDSSTLIDTYDATTSPVVFSDYGALFAGRYRLLRPLGEGGMGNVYLAEDLVLARQVAIKRVRPELSGIAEVRARIKRECRLHAAIGVHPNIVTLYDTVEENDHLSLVMEYFSGETLASLLNAVSGSGGLPFDCALDIVRQLLQALACIHDHDIVHRDIKASNILLIRHQKDGRYLLKLTDFGIARAETEPEAMTRLTSLDTQGPGTPVYMAPERIDPQTFGEICPASDLYAVGIIFFELLTGHPPFTGTMTEIFSGHLVQPPAFNLLPVAIPLQLHAVLRTALAKQPAERYQHALQFITALAEFDDHKTVTPNKDVPQDHTLLAVHYDDVPVTTAATVLNPAMALVTRTTSRQWWQGDRWLYAAAALLVVLAGYLVHNRSNDKSATIANPTGGQAVAVTVSKSKTVAPAVADPMPLEKQQANSALEAVENVRQQTNIEAMAVAERNTSKPGNEWQVIESRSRKIR